MGRAPHLVQDKVTAAPGTWARLVRLLVSTCLYLASKDVEVVERLTPAHERIARELKKWPKKTAKHKEAAKRQPRFHVVFPSLTQLLEVERSGPRLHWVRGHWRLTWVGAGRSAQELRWVRPHWRGGRTLQDEEGV